MNQLLRFKADNFPKSVKYSKYTDTGIYALFSIHSYRISPGLEEKYLKHACAHMSFIVQEACGYTLNKLQQK